MAFLDDFLESQFSHLSDHHLQLSADDAFALDSTLQMTSAPADLLLSAYAPSSTAHDGAIDPLDPAFYDTSALTNPSTDLSAPPALTADFSSTIPSPCSATDSFHSTATTHASPPASAPVRAPGNPGSGLSLSPHHGPSTTVSPGSAATSSSRPPTSPVDTPMTPVHYAVHKRQRNTEAARRYRQRKVDRVTELEDALRDMTAQRDELRLKLARSEAEASVLKAMVERK